MNGGMLLVILGVVLGFQVLAGDIWGRLNISGNPGSGG